MKIIVLLTTASITLFTLAMPQIAGAQSKPINNASSQSNQSKKKPRDASQYDQTARMGMYYAVMCQFNRADGRTAQAREYAEKALSLLKSPGG